MFKRTIVLVVAVLILYAISDWKKFTEQVSPLIEPIRNWTLRQSIDDEEKQNANSNKRRDVDEEESPSKPRWPDDSDSIIVELDESRETLTRPLSSPTPTTVHHGESGRLLELREQLMELNRRDQNARKARLERIQAELWEAQHEVELLKREISTTGDSSELKVKIRLASNRVADLRALRDQLISTTGE